MDRLQPAARAYVMLVWGLGLLAAGGADLLPAPQTRGEPWEIENAVEPITVVSRATLPAAPKILVLPGH